jgi:hypothetical protein
MKKLIPALCMLLVAASLLGTSTFAWFSMNEQVTATGMTVTAISDAIYLEISGTQNSGNFGPTGTNNLAASLYPVAHEDVWDAKADITDFDLDDDAEGLNDNWYYRYNKNDDNATNAMTDKKYISAFANYVAETSYDVQLRPGAGTIAYDLYVSNITIPANSGITVVIAGENGYKEFKASASDIAFSAADVLSDTVTTATQTVYVYIYIDGNDANVYTANIAALTGAVEFTLDVSITDHQ